MDEKLEKGSELLKKAVLFEMNNQNIESYNAYKFGLQYYMDYLKECPEEKKEILRDRILKLVTRAERVKKKMEEAIARASSSSNAVVVNGSKDNTNEPRKNETKHDEEIIIEDNSKGYGYEKIFGRLLKDEIHTIKVEEPYLRTHQQYFNFIRFCELVVKRCTNLRKIIVVTGLENVDQGSKEYEEFLGDIKKSLKNNNINIEFTYVPNLHDRKITFSNGWVVKIGRGLHYFKPKRSKFCIGNFDLDLAPCHQCTVDIYFTEGLVID